MKVINNCLIFNKEEMHLPCECMVAEEHEFIETLSVPKVLLSIKEDPSKKEKAIRMCQRILDIDKLIDGIRQQGEWPKASAYTPPFDHDFSQFLAKLAAEELLKFFQDNYERFNKL